MGTDEKVFGSRNHAPPLFYPESKNLEQLLQEFKHKPFICNLY